MSRRDLTMLAFNQLSLAVVENGKYVQPRIGQRIVVGLAVVITIIVLTVCGLLLYKIILLMVTSKFLPHALVLAFL